MGKICGEEGLIVVNDGILLLLYGHCVVIMFLQYYTFQSMRLMGFTSAEQKIDFVSICMVVESTSGR